MTPAELAMHPKVREALGEFRELVYDACVADDETVGFKEREADEALTRLIATLLTVLRESEGKVLDFEVAEDAARRIERTDFFDWSTMSKPYEAALEAQAAERMGALEVRIKELEGVSCDYCGRALKRISEAPR